MAALLDELNVKYDLNEEDGYIISGWDIGGRSFYVLLTVIGDWVWMKAQIVSLSDVPEEKRCDLLRDLLRAHSELNEVRYELSSSEVVGTTQEIPLEGLNLDNFRSEFTALIFGIEYFMDNLVDRYGIDREKVGVSRPKSGSAGG